MWCNKLKTKFQPSVCSGSPLIYLFTGQAILKHLAKAYRQKLEAKLLDSCYFFSLFFTEHWIIEYKSIWVIICKKKNFIKVEMTSPFYVTTLVFRRDEDKLYSAWGLDFVWWDLFIYLSMYCNVQSLLFNLFLLHLFSLFY